MSESYNLGDGRPSLGDIESATMRAMLGTRCFTSPALVIGSGDASKVKIASTVNYCIDNVMYVKTTAEIAFTDLTVQPIASTRYYLLSLNAAGTGVITTGTATDLPAVPADNCPIGYVKIITDADSTFTPATTDLDAATTFTSVTYVNISQMPLTLS